jgi:isoleucyl-tRNA synthetase
LQFNLKKKIKHSSREIRAQLPTLLENRQAYFILLDSWFIKITEVRDRMFELNETINWKPKSTGEGRFGTG